ncbi:hypothetical protein, partial [Tritonibacter mobilis]|uniref:hypothetical protein n=1 Tax=Tritonibacter mobilis TaxID=379347 RepID=UPI0013A603EA
AAGQLLNPDAQTLAEWGARFQTAQTAPAGAAPASPKDSPAPSSWGEKADVEWDTTDVVEAEAPRVTDWSDFDDVKATGT